MGIVVNGSVSIPVAPVAPSAMNMQSFVATANQSSFTISTFTLTSVFLTIVNDAPQLSATRLGQVVTLVAGVPLGSLIVIYG